MARIHIHIAVDDLVKSIQFYSTVFGQDPTKTKNDYAKWELDSPMVNFAISKRGHANGLNHLGIQVDSERELSEIAQRLEEADINVANQEQAACCYARSNKHWSIDPSGIAWEAFHTINDIAVFGEDSGVDRNESAEACCIPLSKSQDGSNESACCVPGENNQVSECC